MLAVETPLLRASLAPTCEAQLDLPVSRAAVDLRRVKAEVPDVRRRVGDACWARRVNTPLPREPKGSRAFHKMREMYLTCALPPPASSLHLCEAPGGFVQATRDWVEDRPWRWTAATLPDGIRPLYDSFLLGDVLDPHFQQTIVDATGSVELVTADGALDMDHDSVEAQHFSLLVAQCDVAMRVLAEGGTFVVKFFEGQQRPTLALIASLTTHFNFVSILKPNTSRLTNSERYLVCRRREGRALFLSDVDRLSVSSAWLEHASEIMDRYAERQTRALRQCLASV